MNRIVYTDPINPYTDVRSGNQNEFKAALRLGPVGVAFAASDTFMYYSDGIYDADCDPRGVNHGMVAIGYGTENGFGYALVRNSWGRGWGEQGYVRVRMETSDDAGGKCDMYLYPNYPNML
jgi:C1A family cysteine protease